MHPLRAPGMARVHCRDASRRGAWTRLKKKDGARGRGKREQGEIEGETKELEGILEELGREKEGLKKSEIVQFIRIM